MTNIQELYQKSVGPERVVQFGEGGFLRGFVDWMFQKLSDAGKFDGNIVIVQPIEKGMCDALSAQNCLYTHVMRGLDNGVPTVNKDVVRIVSRCVKPYDDFDAYLALAENPDLRFVVSNTTEAGIAYHEGDKLTDRPAVSYPAKLTQFLYHRFEKGLGGLILLPCELIDRNGDKLKELVLRYATEWNLGAGFSSWIQSENHFCCTLVDRIVTGFPKDEDLALGYDDTMRNTSELFHLWVIEGDSCVEKELPLKEIGLNVVFTDNLELYRTRKVRILNGAHTSLVPYAMLRGFQTVGDCMNNKDMRAYLEKCVYEEIIPTLDLTKEELTEYADGVFERFANPYIRHMLSSIVLNSVSKFKVRVLPSILEYKKRFGTYPETLLKGFAALLDLYKTDMANDDAEIMTFLKTATLDEALAREDYWGMDLSVLKEEVVKYANSSH
ncbi:MAG: tagaturonate reductase [Clostridia bacterium]|nr:tagaturonate reductase [Clostridia bacterium]